MTEKEIKEIAKKQGNIKEEITCVYCEESYELEIQNAVAAFNCYVIKTNKAQVGYVVETEGVMPAFISNFYGQTALAAYCLYIGSMAFNKLIGLICDKKPLSISIVEGAKRALIDPLEFDLPVTDAKLIKTLSFVESHPVYQYALLDEEGTLVGFYFYSDFASITLPEFDKNNLSGDFEASYYLGEIINNNYVKVK